MSQDKFIFSNPNNTRSKVRIRRIYVCIFNRISSYVNYFQHQCRTSLVHCSSLLLVQGTIISCVNLFINYFYRSLHQFIDALWKSTKKVLSIKYSVLQYIISEVPTSRKMSDDVNFIFVQKCPKLKIDIQNNSTLHIKTSDQTNKS